MNVLGRQEVLKLNKIHEAIRVETPEKVFGDLATYKINKRTGEFLLLANGQKQRKMLAYQIEFYQRPDGTYIFPNDPDYKWPQTMELVDWDVWAELPVRPYDLYVNTAKRRIRIPRVVMSLLYEDMPKKKFSLNFNTVYEIYKGTCAYTNKKLKRSEANIDHIIPRAKGGKNTWKNVCLSDSELNSRKGDRYNHEAGLPNVTPIEPQELPMTHFLKNEKGIPEWDLFLRK